MSRSETLTIKSYLRRYPVWFTGYAGRLRLQTRGRKCFFLLDSQVARAYAKPLKPFLPPERTMVLRAVEDNKTMDMVSSFVQFLLKADFKRNDCLIAIGGGIVQDIAGFTASTLFRGIDWYFYPTTLLAQADSCIGSKNCINVGKFKNQLGTFYPPAGIVLDTAFLKTLSKVEICSGLGEIIKFCILDSRKSFTLIDKHYDAVFSDEKLMNTMIRHSLKIKKKLAQIDEFDKGIRNIFNYGHTFGHAIESLTDYAIPHGQAITLGMGLANYISWKLGYLKKADYDRMKPLITKNAPAFAMSASQEKDYLRHLSKDKKNIGDKLTCILLRAPGRAFKTTIPFDGQLRAVILEYFSGEH